MVQWQDPTYAIELLKMTKTTIDKGVAVMTNIENHSRYLESYCPAGKNEAAVAAAWKEAVSFGAELLALKYIGCSTLEDAFEAAVDRRVVDGDESTAREKCLRMLRLNPKFKTSPTTSVFPASILELTESMLNGVRLLLVAVVSLLFFADCAISRAYVSRADVLRADVSHVERR